ncbi:MAG: type II toxin-antitoxin system PemK/MazF family toxin [Bifidobacteriaceae bacterium]|jgi:mRNA interferase MazF|nr:type II toxin-antitoxin system PemK/MazF family toxin [Bifidobacteriaceae bacterium]
MTPGTDDPLRGEIWLAALGKGRPDEPGKARPVVVISPSTWAPYRADDLVTVAPLSASSAPGPDRIWLAARPGLNRDSLAVARAARPIARSRLLRQVARIEPGEEAALDYALAMSLGLA